MVPAVGVTYPSLMVGPQLSPILAGYFVGQEEK
jgi:hypothetical protein